MVDNDKSLIPLPGDEFPDLEEIKKSKYEAALRNLITGITPRDVIYQKPARGGADIDYVPGWWFVEQLNALFGYLWDFEVVEQFVGEKQVWVKGKLTVKSSSGLTVSKTAFGGSDIKKYSDRSEKAGQVIDIGDDLKAAATDAMKKASTLLGMAADIYGKREKLEQGRSDKSQLNALYKVGSSKDMSKEQVDDLCMKKHDKTPDELESIEVLGLISELRSK